MRNPKAPMYGAPRIHAELAEVDELHVGCKRVARLVRAEGLRGFSRRKVPHTTQRKPGARAALDLVQRNFTADTPNRLWVADITYIATWTGWLYLAVVVDCFDNALCESFFATQECELFDRNTFHNRTEARQALFKFINGWCNPYRRHSAIDYLSPNWYEALHARTPHLASHQVSTETG